MDAFESSLSEIVAALSHALDLTEGQPRGHAGRTCLIGMRIGDAMGISAPDRSALYYALLLKDSGCSSSAVRMATLFGADDIALKRAGKLVDWTRPTKAVSYVARGVGANSPVERARRTIRVALEISRRDGLVDARCERGAQILLSLGFPAAAADAVRALDEHWDGHGKPQGLRGEDIPLLARIACIAQTAEVFVTARGVTAARRMVRKRRGRWFDPAVCDAFLAIADADPLWGQLADDVTPASIAAVEPDGQRTIPSLERIDLLAEAFAQVIDAKSSFTFRHSEGVARIAVDIGRQFGMDASALRRLRWAGLLHDIGKLGVSSAILEKPGRLSAAETAEIRLHPLYTEQILSQVRAFDEIALSAAAHHERLDGRGYHRGLVGDEIPVDGRILAVADVYEALTADRPYRSGLTAAQARAVMRADVGAAFCPHAFAALEAVTGTGGRVSR